MEVEKTVETFGHELEDRLYKVPRHRGEDNIKRDVKEIAV